MKVIFIYATKPELRALGLVKDQSDAKELIQRSLAVAEAKLNAARERAAATGGTIATLAAERWGSARWVEVELDVSD